MAYEANLDETNRLIAADRVQGTDVYNARGDKLGSVDSVMIDKISGKVAYAVMSFGGFLGIGEKYHPLPWSTLDYDTNENGYRVNIDEETLKNAPTVSRDDKVDWTDETWGRRVHEHYGAAPYWV